MISAKHTDDRTNLRPIVLAVCFAWGVTIGFIANALSSSGSGNQTATTRPKPTETEQTTPNQKDPKVNERDLIEQAIKDPPKPEEQLTSIDKDPIATEVSDDISLLDKTPAPPPVTLDTGVGLTGVNAPPPPSAPTVTDSPDLPDPIRRKQPQKVRPPELDF